MGQFCWLRGPRGSVLKLPARWAHSMDQLVSADTGMLGFQSSRGQEGQLMLWMLMLMNNWWRSGAKASGLWEVHSTISLPVFRTTCF